MSKNTRKFIVHANLTSCVFLPLLQLTRSFSSVNFLYFLILVILIVIYFSLKWGVNAHFLLTLFKITLLICLLF